MWAIGVPRDLALVLSAEWGRRSKLRAGAARLTVGEVNTVLDRIDRAHPDRGHGKAERLGGLVTGQASALEIKWLVRILQRNLLIGERPAMPVAHKGEYDRTGSSSPVCPCLADRRPALAPLSWQVAEARDGLFVPRAGPCGDAEQRQPPAHVLMLPPPALPMGRMRQSRGE